MTAEAHDGENDFIVAAVVPRAGSPYGGAHSNGRMKPAAAILAQHPDIGTASIHTAAILGDADAVERFIAADAANATTKGGPYEWDALTHLCFSNYLKEDRARTPGFVRAATALLDAGASANTGWWAPEDFPHPSWEPAIYGACGVAHHPELTRLLVERGAELNDPELAYHAPEGSDNTALRVLLDSGRLTSVSLGVMVIRKIDWHDGDGLRLVLAAGAPADGAHSLGWRSLHHALMRCSDIGIITLLLDHGADPMRGDGMTAVVRAAHEGRHDVLNELEKRGVSLDTSGVDRLVMALARGNDDVARETITRDPALREQVIAKGGELLSKWCGAWNWDGMRRLLELGVPANAPYAEGDGYFSIPKGALPIQVAAWYISPKAIRLLIDHGADVNARHPQYDMSPLQLYALGATESHWTDGRTVDGARMLLDAGADVHGVRYPTGYDELDALLKERGATPYVPPARRS